MAERNLEDPAQKDTSLQEAMCDPHKHQGTPRYEKAQPSGQLGEARKHRRIHRGNAIQRLSDGQTVTGREGTSHSSLPRRGDKLEQRRWATAGLIPHSPQSLGVMSQAGPRRPAHVPLLPRHKPAIPPMTSSLLGRLNFWILLCHQLICTQRAGGWDLQLPCCGDFPTVS